MNIKFWNQPKSATLEKILNEKLRKGFKRVWIVAGMTKDSGVDMVFDSIMTAREMGSEVNVLIGIDRKNTSKDMLMKLLGAGCNLFVHINRDDSKVETRVYVFENDDESYVYLSGGKFSEGGLSTNYCLIQEIIYSADDKKSFDNFKSVLLQSTEDVFKSVGEDDVKLLAEKGEMVVRIIERKIPRISEMYGNSSIESIGNDMYDESSGTKLFEIPEDDDFHIDIDIDIDGKVKKSELSVETEARKAKEQKESIDKLADEKLSRFYENKSESENDKKVNIIKDVDNIDFSSVKIFVFELNKIIEKGVGEGEIRVPHYLYENMINFFGDNYKIVTDDNGKERLANVVKLNILDVSTNEKITDDNVFMYDNGKSFAIKSKMFKSLKPREGDIVRFIKISENEFEVELIRSDVKEYNVWENFCKYTMKNSKRKFGIM